MQANAIIPALAAGAAFATDLTVAYTGGNEGIRAVRKCGGSPWTHVKAPVMALAVGGSWLYYADATGIRRVPIAGAPRSVVAAAACATVP